jgi:hypothetical protein
MKTLSIYQKTKAVAIFCAIFLAVTSLQAQDITGQWNGAMTFQGVTLRIVFHINKTGEGYTSTMDSPDQGANGIPVTTTTLNGSRLSLAIPAIGVLYEGEFKTDSIVGTFNQGGLSLPMTMKKPAPVETKPVVYLQDNITGQWNGVLSVQGMNLRIVFHINKTNEGYISTMDSPDQNANRMTVTATTFDGSKLSLSAPALGVLYEGELKNNSVEGIFKQGTLSVPMTLKR